MEEASAFDVDEGDARAAVRTALTSGKALEHFAQMVTLLGGPADVAAARHQRLVE